MGLMASVRCGVHSTGNGDYESRPAKESDPVSAKAEWQKRLLAELGDLLARFGFSFVAARRSFHKPTPVGWQSIHLAIIQHPADFDVVVDAAVRLDLIQARIGGATDRRGHQATIGCEYGNLLGTGQHRWTVAAASDLDPVARDILKACESTLFHFLETYSDLETVYETLMREDQYARLLMPLEDVRKAIVVAAEAAMK